MNQLSVIRLGEHIKQWKTVARHLWLDSTISQKPTVDHPLNQLHCHENEAFNNISSAMVVGRCWKDPSPIRPFSPDPACQESYCHELELIPMTPLQSVLNSNRFGMNQSGSNAAVQKCSQARFVGLLMKNRPIVTCGSPK